ncbi:MAG: VCBS repeat-containing protein [Cyclobacteriaceae bacterium]
MIRNFTNRLAHLNSSALRSCLAFVLVTMLAIPLTAQDPVAYYPFNGNANDESTNTNNGTVTGATPTTDRFGNADAAYGFDGANDYITTSLTFSNNQPLSVSMWVYWNGSAGDQTAVSWLDASLTNKQFFGVNGSGSLIFGDGFQTGTALSASQWVHLGATYDGSQSIIYINGVQSDVSTAGLTYQFDNLTIGRQGNNDGEYWDGKIDDIRIYDVALSASAISDLYAQESLAVEPTAAPTNIVFSNNSGGCFTFNYTASTDPNVTGYMSVFNSTAAPTFVPEDGVEYAFDFTTPKSDGSFNWGSDAVTGKNLCGQKNTTYYIETWAYSGDGSARNYLTSESLTASITTQGDPTIESISPDSGFEGTTVVITGTNFDETASNNLVTFGGAEATIIGIPTTTSLTVLVPADATTGKVSVTVGVTLVTNASNTVESTSDFTIASPPIIASYSFSGDANDDSGNGFNGTVSGPQSTKDRFGSPSSAYAFDGDDIIEFGDLTVSPQALTMVSWFKTNNDFTSSYGTCFDLEGAGAIQVSENNFLRGVLQLGEGNFVSVEGDALVNDNKWHQAVLTFDGNDMVLYLDGLLTGTPVDYTGEAFFSLNPVPGRVGYSFDGNDRYFIGDIDEVKYYSTALSASEVAATYDKENAGLNLYYALDGNLSDESENGITASLPNGGSYTTDRFGNASSAIQLGATRQHILVDNGDNPLVSGNAITFSAWINANAFDNGSSSFLFTSPDMIAYINSDGNFGAGICGSGGCANVVTVSPQAELNKWTYFVATYDGSIATVYIDGAPAGSLQFDIELDDASGVTHIGANSSGSETFMGVMDEVRIYDRALTASEVSSLYGNEESDLLAYYPFNGNANDESGNGNNGTLGDGSTTSTLPTLTTDRFGVADAGYSFDGASDYIQTDLLLTDNAPFTTSVWVYWNGSSGVFEEILGFRDVANTAGTFFGVTSNDLIRFAGDTDYTLIAEQWIHLVSTFDGTNFSLFVDGELVFSDTRSLTFTEMTIGALDRSGSESWSGSIDDVRIYGSALSATDVLTLYQSEKPDLTYAYFEFNNNLNDSSDKGNNASDGSTGNSFAADRVGASSQAFNKVFSGGAPSISGSANYDFGNELTVSAWIRPDTYSTIDDILIVSNGDGFGNGFDLSLVLGDVPSADQSARRQINAAIHGISSGYIGDVYIDRWMHIAMRYTRNVGVSAFVNGVNIGSFGAGSDSGVLPSPSEVSIGSNFDGFIDEVRIIQEALTDAEISALYEEDKWPFDVLALRGPESGMAEDLGLDINSDNTTYHKVLNLTEAGTYQFRATNLDTGFEAFMGDNEADGIAEPGGTLLDLTTGLHGIRFNQSDFAYVTEPIASIGFIGSARTGDVSGWDAEDQLTDLGNGIYQIREIRLFDGEWKLRMNDQWGLLDWGWDGATSGALTYGGSNIPVTAGTYTLTVDIINNLYTLVDLSSSETVVELALDGDLLDTSGFGNNGASVNTQFTTSRFGSDDQSSAFLLSASELIDIGSATELQLSNGFSMNMWINPTDNTNQGHIFNSFESFHQHIYATYFDWRYFQNGAEIPINNIPVTAPNDTWTMFTWVYDGGQMRFYDDGVLVHSETVYGDIDTPGNAYEIGNGFDGAIDEFIWVNGVLSDKEIKYLYTNGTILEYTFDNNTTDQSGNTIDGTLPGGGIYVADRFDNASSALELDGTNQYVLVGNGDEPLITGNEITFEGWFKADDFSSGPFLFSSPGIIAFISAIGLPAFAPQTSLVSEITYSSLAISENEWFHFAGTYDGSTTKVYVNGVETASEQRDVEMHLTDLPSQIGGNAGTNFNGVIDDIRVYNYALNEDEIIERYHVNGRDVSDINFFRVADTYTGTIDYNDAIIDVEVPFGTDLTSLSARMIISRGASNPLITSTDGTFTQDFTNPLVTTVTGYDGTTTEWTINVTIDKELFAYYSFDGDVLDVSGNGYDAQELTGSMSFPKFSTDLDPPYAGIGQSYLFDESHTLTLENTANFDFGDEITVTAWIQSEIYNQLEPEIISTQGSPGFDFKLSNGPADTNLRSLKAELFGTGTFISTGELALNQWYHVAFTYKRNDAMKLYLNGSELGTIAAGDNPISVSTNDLRLGDGMAGLLDELRIFNRALTGEEIFGVYAENLTDLLPQVHHVSPESALSGETIRVHGFNLNQPSTAVSFGGIYASPTEQAATYLEVVVPDGIVGPVSLIVDGPSGLSNEIVNFTGLRSYTEKNFVFSSENQINTNTEFRRAVDYADIDNDGDYDLISGGQGSVIANINDGTGNFGDDIVIASGFSGSDIYSLAPGDFDDDGDIDIVFSDAINGDIYLISNGGDNVNWSLVSIYLGTAVPYSLYLEVLDFDQDGDLDILSANGGTNGITFLRNDGSDTFTSLLLNNVDDTNFLDKGDVDLDGDLDFVVSTYNETTGNNTITIWWADGSGGGSSGQQVSATVSGVESVHLVDINGDGNLDVLTGTSDGTGKIYWYENKPETGFTDWTENTIESDFSADEIISGDLDGDGDQDVIAVTFGSSNGQTMFWYENQGDGTFSTRNEIGFNRSGASSVKAVDLDNDGDLDLLASGYFAVDPIGGWVSWVENLNSDAEFLSFSFGIDGEVLDFDNTNRIITIEVPNGTDLSNLVPVFTVSEGAFATADVDGNGLIQQESGVSSVDFNLSIEYNVGAEDGDANTNWVVNATRTDGRLAYYDFEANTEDVSGNSYHLTNSGATLTTDRFDNADAAYNFDGTSSQMSRSRTDLLGGEDQASLVFWIKPSKLNDTFQEIVSFGNMRAYINDGNHMKIQLFTSGVNGQYDASVEVDKWQQYVMTYDGVNIKVYRDALLTDDVEKGGKINLNQAAQMYIGSQGSSTYYEGAIDGIEVYNYALSETDIQTLYNSGGWPLNEVATDISLTSTSVAENQDANTLVGTLSNNDPDSGDSHTYSFVDETGGEDFASFVISGDQLLTNEVFDFETKSSYNVIISVDDQNGGIFQEQFTITVIDIVNENLILSYPFNGNADDESGNGNNGTVTDAVLTADRFGNADAAYRFDGDGDFIEATDVPTPGNISVSGWFRSNADYSSGFANFFTFPGIGMGIGVENFLDAAMQLTEGNFTVLSSTGQVNDGNWHHGVSTFDGSTMKLYLDGVMIAESTGHSGDIFFDDVVGNMQIGFVNADGLRYFTGDIDDIRMHNNAITAEDVQSLYSEGGWPLIPDPIVTYYPFNNNANDEAGNVYNGNTANVGFFSSSRYGELASSLEMEGDGTFVFVDHAGDWDMRGEVMVTGWIRPNELPEQAESGHIIFREENFGELSVGSDGGVFYNWENGTVTMQVGAVKNRQWNMVTMVISEQDYVKLYLDGQLQKISLSGVATNVDSIQITRHTGVGNIAYFGSNNAAGSDDRWFNGSMDDFRIHINDSYSHAQIRDLYESEISGGLDELVAFFPFNSGDLADASGNSYGVEYRNVNNEGIAANTTTDRYGDNSGALLFDNTGNSAHVFHERSINLRRDFTVNLWISPTSFAASGGTELGDVLISDNAGGRLMIFQNGVLAYHYPVTETNFPDVSSDADIVSLDEWQMVTYSIGEDDQLRTYHNGVLLRSESVADHQINLPDRFIIAQADKASDNDERYYDGAIDDVGVYQRVLSDQEVADLFIAGDPSSTEAEITAFSFDSQTGSATIDDSANTISIEVGVGTSLTDLVAEFTLSSGASADIGAVRQVSGTTANDFTNPITYTVTSGNGLTTKSWVVTVNRVINTDTDIINFDILNQIGDEVINTTDHTVLVNMPFETNASALTPVIELPFGATINPESGVEANFTNTVVYTVTAEDGVTSQDWDVTVNVPLVANSTPTAITFLDGVNEIPENENVGFSLTLMTTDSDVGDTHTYSFVDGTNDNGNFTLDETENNKLLSSTVFNFEDKNSYTVQIQTEDTAGATHIQDLTINITDADDPADFTPVSAPTTYTLGSESLTISADVIDQDDNSVVLRYRKLSEIDFSSVNMDQDDVTYSASLTETQIGLIGVEYFVESTDKFGTEASAKQIASVERSESNALSIDEKVTPGNAVSNYSIIAFPFQSASVGTVFNGLGTYDDTKWRLLRYNGTGYSDYKSGSLSPGVGYFFITTTAADINVSGKSVTVTDGEFALPLVDGFNLIGNPFQGTLNWTDVITYNVDQGNIASNVVSDLIRFNSQFVSGGTSLSRLEGAFVEVEGSAPNFVIPTSAISGTGGRATEAFNAPQEVFIDNQEWEFDLFLAGQDYKYSVGGIGLNNQANDHDDSYDLGSLPRFDIYIDVEFEDGNTRSIKRSDGLKVWNFTVPNNLDDKYIDMTWDIPVSSGKTIIFVDGASHQIYDLSVTRGIQLLNNSSATHQLYYGDKEEIFANLDLPFDALFSIYPNPVRDLMNLELYSTSNKTVKVEFISIEGKVTYTELIDLQQGLTRKEIDLLGKSVSEGVYLIKVDSKIMTKFIKL